MRINQSLMPDDMQILPDISDSSIGQSWPTHQNRNLLFIYYLRILWKWAWLIILCGLTTGVISSIVSLRFLPPVYQSSTTLMVKVSGQTSETAINGNYNDYDTFLANEYMTTTFKELSRQRAVIEIAAGKTGLSPSTVSDSVGIDIIPKTPLMILSAQSQDPKMAMLIANSMSSSLIQVANQSDWMPGREVVMLEQAITPRVPISPNIKLNVVIAMIAGILLGAIAVFLMEYIWLYS